MSAAEIIHEVAFVSARDAVLSAKFRGLSLEQIPDLEAALIASARVLAEGGVTYALIGGLAVSIRSNHRRATLDVDLAIPSDEDHANLIGLMTDAGFEFRGSFPHSLNFRFSGGEPVQLTFDDSYDSMIDRAEVVSFGSSTLRVLKIEDLIASKLAASQNPTRRKSKVLQDLSDIEMLKGDVPLPDEGW